MTRVASASGSDSPIGVETPLVTPYRARAPCPEAASSVCRSGGVLTHQVVGAEQAVSSTASTPRVRVVRLT
jgi:hypothetical protein